MKKNYLMMAAFATALAFTACSNEDEIPAADNGNGTLGLTEDVIEIAISNTGVGSTRTARPVGSSAADNNVNKVQLVFFEGASTTPVTLGSGDDQLNLTVVTGETGYSITNGLISYDDAEVTEGVPGEDTRETKVAKIKVGGLKAETNYTIVAYGYNGDAFPYGTPTQVTDKLYYQTGTHSLSGLTLEEVFAAKTTATTTANLGTAEAQVVKFSSSVRVELTRQVAGMLAYFKNVPATIGGKAVKKITVEANDKSDGFYFPAVLWGEEASQHAEFNGFKTTGGSETLLTFTIDNAEVDAATNTYKFNTTGSDGQKYQLADGITSVSGLVCEDNTLFGGRFILPYSGHVSTGDATLVVKIMGESDAVLKTLKVTTDQYKSDLSGSRYQYDILCNNFYSIGQKLATEETDGGTPDPGTDDDDDDPADLSNTDELVVVVNDAWEVIHNMGLE